MALKLTQQYSSPFLPTTSVDANFPSHLVEECKMGLRAVLKPDSYKDQSKARRAVSNVKSKLQTWGHGEWGLVVPKAGWRAISFPNVPFPGF
jgi:hypothetical protein